MQPDQAVRDGALARAGRARQRRAAARCHRQGHPRHGDPPPVAGPQSRQFQHGRPGSGRRGRPGLPGLRYRRGRPRGWPGSRPRGGGVLPRRQQAAVRHPEGAVRERADQLPVMTDQQHRPGPRAPARAQQGAQLVGQPAVQPAGRLVQDEQDRVAERRDDQGRPLGLTTRDLVRVAAQERPVGGQVHLRQRPFDPLARPRAAGRGGPGAPRRLAEQAAEPAPRVERGGRILAEEGDHPGTDPGAARGGERIDAADPYRARTQREPGAEVPQQAEGERGLARARPAVQGEGLPGVQPQAGAVEYRRAAGGRAHHQPVDRGDGRRGRWLTHGVLRRVRPGRPGGPRRGRRGGSPRPRRR